MSPTSWFKTTLIAVIATGIIETAAGSSLADTLPLLLQEYLAQVDNETFPEGSVANSAFFAALSLFILYIVTFIGLWKFKHWARTLYLAVMVVSLPFYLFAGPVVMNPWEAMFGDLSLLLEGAMVAMMFTEPLNEKFKPQR